MLDQRDQMNDSIQLGSMTEHQAEETCNLFGNVLSETPYYNDHAKEAQLTKYTASRLRALIADDPGAVLVAIVASKLVGYCISEIDDGTIWLDWFGVQSNFRRQGIGLGLVKSLGIGATRLMSLPASWAAQWKALGLARPN